MKNRLKIDVDDENIYIKIDGDNIELLNAMSLILKKMERESGLTTETSMRYLKDCLESDIE